MIRRDELQLRMEIDGKQAISELGKQEMAAYEYRQELKQISEEQTALEAESKKLDKIRERYDKLTKQIQELEAAGKTNTKQYEKVTAQFGKTAVELRSAEQAQKALTESQKRYTETSKQLEVTKGRITSLRAEMGLTGMTMRQLRQYQRDLSSQMDVGVTRGTQKYEELKQKLNEVNARIREQRAEVNGTNSAWAKMKSEIAKFGVLALGYLGAQELLGRVQNLVKGTAELSDAISDVEKTTGLANSTVKELSNEFKNMDTRTARRELLGMAEIAGRLGIQSKEEVLGFVKAANQVNVALGDSLGDVETVMRELGKLTSTYKIKEAYGIEESLLRVGSAINELGMASTANEGNIVNFTKRMGGIAPLAKITIQEILGLGATLDSLGQTPEVAGTALSKLFINMAKNATQYARFAKMEVADFVKLMNEDANEAFIRVLEGVKENSAGITELAASLGDLGEDGGRVVGVLGTLASNTKTLREQQSLSNRAFAEGTSITEEYRVKNENLAASLAKVQRWIAGVFINNAFMGFLEKSIGKLAEWVSGIDAATKAFQNQQGYIDSLEKKLPDLIARYNLLNSFTVKNAEEQEEMRSIIEQIAKLVPTAVTEFDKYGKAMDINTGKVREFTKAQQEAAKVLNAEAIKEQQTEMKKLERDIMQVTWALEKRDADGDLFKYVTSASGLSQKAVKLTADEIRALQSELTTLNDQMLGRKTILDELMLTDSAFKQDPKSLGRAGALAAKAKPGEGSSFIDDKKDDSIDKMLEKFKDFQQQVKDLEADAEINRMDKDSREIAQIEQKFQQLREKALEYYDKGYLDQANYNETINQINALQDESVNLKIDEQSQVILDKRKKLQEDIELLELDDQERAIEQAERRFDALISQAQELGLSTVELERLKLEAIAKLNADYDQKLLQQKQQTNERQLQADVQLRQAQIEYTMEYSRIAGAAIDLVGKKGGELTAFQKILALAQIGIDTGAAIMKAELVALQAASVGGPAAPFIYKATKLSIIGSILTAAARAKDLFSNSDIPDFGGSTGNSEKAPPVRRGGPTVARKSFYFGGPTGDGLGFGDQYGEYAGYVHRHEYVIPQAVRQEPIVRMQIEPLLESLRMRSMSGRSFYNGGESSPMPAGNNSPAGQSPGMGSDPEIKQLLRVIAQATSNWPKEIRGKWMISDLEEAQEERDYLEDRYRAK